MKFIRKNGRIIPIKEKGEKKDNNAKHMSRLKPKTKNQVTGSVAGAATGAIVGAKKLGQKFSYKGAVFGGLAGLALGSMRLKTDEEIEKSQNKQMERDFKKEKPSAYKKFKKKK